MKKMPNLLDAIAKSLTVCGQAMRRTWRTLLGQGALCGLLAIAGCAQKPLDAQLRADCAAQVPQLQPTAADAAAVDEIVAQLGEGKSTARRCWMRATRKGFSTPVRPSHFKNALSDARLRTDDLALSPSSFRRTS